MRVNARAQVVAAARGDRPLDLLIEGIRLVNVYTREIYPADIGVAGGRIVFAGPGQWDGPAPVCRFDGRGKIAVPGLVDTHLHIESSMITPANFAAAVLPRGTTTVMIDPHELANVLGLRAVRAMLDASAGLPLRVFVQAPSCVPAVPALETAGADFGAAEIEVMLGWERVIGLAEVMDYVGVIQQQDRMRRILDVALSRGVIISGHCPGVGGRELAAYMVAGPDSDHETRDRDQLLEKLRAGMVIEGRVSSFSESMSVLADIVRELGHVPPNLVMCTDDIHPEDLLVLGHMDNVVRSAIAAGFPAIDAVCAATLHGAQRLRQRDLGALAPGKRADILLLDDLDAFSVDEVFVDGRLIAQGGRMAEELPALAIDPAVWGTVHLARPSTADDFVLHADMAARTARLRVLTFTPNRRRALETLALPVRDGRVDISAHPDISFVSVIERHGRTANRSLVLVKGLGLQVGATATTVAHDSHNLLVAGRNADDMALIANAVADAGGGIGCALDGRITALLSLPIGGLMSPEPVERLVPEMEALNAALRRQGLDSQHPIANLIGMALPVIPDYGVTDLGLVDVNAQTVVPIWADEA